MLPLLQNFLFLSFRSIIEHNIVLILMYLSYIVRTTIDGYGKKWWRLYKVFFQFTEECLA